jgi:uncharacterized C2H2 Zn-finger protein
MVLDMKRGAYNTVTQLPVLIPCSQEEQDGVANFLPAELLQKGGKLLREGTGFKSRLCPVRMLRDAELRPTSKAKWIDQLGPIDQKRLLGLLSLRQALETRDKLQIEKLEKVYQNLVPDILAEGGQRKVDRATAEIIEGATARTFAQWHARNPNVQPFLARVLTKAIQPAQLVVWWNKGRFLPALYCPDLATAFYVRCMLGIAGGNALVVCPRCGNPFLQERSDQDYCSVRCREAHRVARWRRANKKAKSKKLTKSARR